MARREILYSILKKSYGAHLHLLEAVIAVRSKGLWFEHHREEVINLLYLWRLREEPSAKTLSVQDLKEVMKLLHFHKKLYFFLDDYTKNVPRPPWIDAAEWNKKLPVKMSENEKSRFMRAICRLQIDGNVFGPPEEGQAEPVPRYNDFNTAEAYRLFFGAMPPWEYEEMGCVWSYILSKYDPVVETISQGLRDAMKGNEDKFFWDFLPDDECPAPAVIDRLDDLESLPYHIESFASLGPDFLYRALHAKPIPQWKMVIANTHTSHEPFIGFGIPSWEDRVQFTTPADRHDVRSFEQFWSTLPPLEQPTLGWKKLGLAPHTPEDRLLDALDRYADPEKKDQWPWGYALWDDARF